MLAELKEGSKHPDDEENHNNDAMVLSFLRRMSKASKILSTASATDRDRKMTVDVEDGADIGQRNNDPKFYINVIAGDLLKCCNPANLSAQVDNNDHFPQLNLIEKKAFPAAHHSDEEQRFCKPYVWRKVDYLRKFLRLMASCSMDVAAEVCSITLSSSRRQSTGNKQTVEPFILFSYWLPVAPHLGHMVTDLLRTLNDPFASMAMPMDTTSTTITTAPTRFIIAEACYMLCSFYLDEYGSIETVRSFCDWSFLFTFFTDGGDDKMKIEDEDDNDEGNYFSYETAIRWYSIRCVGKLLDWKPLVLHKVLEKAAVAQPESDSTALLTSNRVPWLPHPWTIDQEELEMQQAVFQGRTKLWGQEDEEFCFPSAKLIQQTLVPASPLLSRIANSGVCFYKDGSMINMSSADSNSDNNKISTVHKKLIQTPTVRRNLSLLSAGLCQQCKNPKPILICGSQGSGKSSLVRELLHLVRPPSEQLLEFHIDEETDSKTLIGTYTTTDIPGEFAWRAGPLTHAIREGRWVLLEDVDSVPVEIQASLVQLFKNRTLALGNGRFERCHPNFRLFGTYSTTITPQKQNSGRRGRSHRIPANRGGGKRVFNPTLWTKVHVKPLPYSELKQIALSIHSTLPSSVVEAAVMLFQSADHISGREASIDGDDSQPYDEKQQPRSGNSLDEEEEEEELQKFKVSISSGGRNPSVRDFFKLLSRVSNSASFEHNATYTTEFQRTLCMAECVDIFVGACPDRQIKLNFIRQVAASTWGISRDLAESYIHTRRPSITIGRDFVDIGRARVCTSSTEAESVHASNKFSNNNSVFAQTNHALRLMESVGVCLRENEPVLLVGETGCGKTSLIQQLATICERDMIVQNLSLQTDSTDLLGGYKPLDIKTLARKIYGEFVDIFVSTFSRKQNMKFLKYASSMLEKSNWKKLSQCFQRAAALGTTKMAKEKKRSGSGPTIDTWNIFSMACERFERQRLSCDAGLAFAFAEGVLVDAIVHGKWVLLDEINLASSETLQRLCGLLDDPTGSVTLTERGDAKAVTRHSDFRLFAAMNPATDAGKKDLPPSIRSRFSEIYVDELLDPLELRVVASRYLESILPNDGQPPENTDIVIQVVDVYLKCRVLAERALVDGAGHKPRYTLRTLSRALSAAKQLVLQQRLPRRRAIFEGFQLAFEGSLDAASIKAVRKVLKILLPDDVKKSDLEHPGRRPGGKADIENYTLVKPFWIKSGPNEMVDWSESSSVGKRRFILTASVASSLRRLSRSLACGNWPVLLEGPTSAGKTTLVEYIAARCGHHVVRINNHEHTDIQEYTGSFAADSGGSLSFRDGLLVRALRFGYWVILDELNLAPSEVLEALNRLLDDNRELFIAETSETVKPHPNFRLFATQNPCGAYGGRKPLSRAFRNRFVEIHMGDIPNAEMKTILEQKCGCPPSHSKHLVDIMVSLRHRRSKSNLFLGKDSFITPRDLLRWAERKGSTKQELAEQGYMLLAERLRSQEERDLVQNVLEETLKVTLRMEEKYYGAHSESRTQLKDILESSECGDLGFLSSVAPTTSLLRLVTLVFACIKQKEPVLLVGDTGCGKTTVVQFLSHFLKQKLHIVNCHATTETSDLLGGLRPVRGRQVIAAKIASKVKMLHSAWPHKDLLEAMKSPRLFLRDEFLENLPTDGDDAMETTGDEKIDASEVAELLAFARAINKARPTREEAKSDKRELKRRKLTPEGLHECSEGDGDDLSLKAQVKEIEELGRRYAALFEWSDGPLVRAMKAGDLILLDEMSLAEDAVLERLNSVLEPSRTLVLAEKGESGPSGSEIGTSVIVAEDGFHIFATMNPGGDFGKRELSPALRSRFTEIWVPQVSHRADFELVLSRALLPRGLQDKSLKSAVLGCMLTYVNWFNTDICGDVSSPFSGHSLTLRDVLSWARFIVDSRAANDNISMWEAYCHGACLMHLDGLGLGSGLSPEDAISARNSSEQFLNGQIPQGITVANLSGAEQSLGIHSACKFGASPFFIPTGCLPIHALGFNLGAPTTAQNMFRVLRAMQVRKPILLEGSPGVGKTSLISALASASGHKLVRINLSEQTDISDLMGSDLPMQDSTANGASFEWCDGVLLTAIKEGSWVLLDELNLATQSVLEGLNSCLDHRAEVFIPELGKNFACPASFRVFAAQNPLGQGGGRKGLPRSFLNRFTKVFVNSLSGGDLRSIVGSKYPTFEQAMVHKMIDFNSEVHNDVVVRHEYGFEGSPWEFNLRDVFRWCELLSSESSSLESHARDLYYQRFRTMPDREKVDQTFMKHFGKTMKSAKAASIYLTESSVTVGDSVLQRQALLLGGPSNPLWQESLVNLSRQMPTEAVSRCIACNWPCLIVGPAGSGKTSIVTSLAELCNTKLVIQCLSPSSDVTELVGCFEQVDNAAEERECLRDLCILAEEFLVFESFDSIQTSKVWSLLLSIKTYISDQVEAADPFSGVFRANSAVHSAALNLSQLLHIESKRNSNISQRQKCRLEGTVSRLQRCNQGGDKKESGNDSHFVWRDGSLVEAMEMGFWLLLENVNLCPSSVLDRLNSVMERDGELLLSECGRVDGSDGESSHRRIKPHENFRIFLSMDSINGEVSRAMRNRCVEVSISPQSNKEIEAAQHRLTTSNQEKIDCLGLLQREGVRSTELATLILSFHSDERRISCSSGEEPPCLSEAIKSSSILKGLTLQGISGIDAMRHFLQLSFQVDEESVEILEQEKLRSLAKNLWTGLPQSTPIRSGCQKNSSLKSVPWEARLLRVVSSGQSGAFHALTSPELGFFEEIAPEHELGMMRHGGMDLCNFLVQFYLTRATSTDFDSRCDYFTGLESTMSFDVGWMASFMRNNLILPDRQIQASGESSSAGSLSVGGTWFSLPEKIRRLQSDRLCQRLLEWKWLRDVSSRHSVPDVPQEMSVLEASFYANESLLPRGSESCPVLPLLHPFFACLDRFIYLVLYDAAHWNFDAESNKFLNQFALFLDERDILWCHLQERKLCPRPGFTFSFEESEFIVQWQRIRNFFVKLIPGHSLSGFGDSTKSHMSKLEQMMNSIDRAVFGSSLRISMKMLRKKMIKPRLPYAANYWDMIFQIRALSEKCTVLSEQVFNPFSISEASIDMQSLVDSYHPTFYTSLDDRIQLLTALCTIYWSWTDEVQPEEPRNISLVSDISFGIKLNELHDQKRRAFVTQVARAKIDLDISTVDNRLSADVLEELQEKSQATISSGSAYDSLGKSLLSSFQRIQVSGLTEFWCANEETRICNEICSMLLDCSDPRQLRGKLIALLPGVKRLVEAVLSGTIWSVVEMRPFQTLVWVLEASSEGKYDIRELLRCLLPSMLFSRSRHLSLNSFVNNTAISDKLELPSTWIDDEVQTATALSGKENPEKQFCRHFGSKVLRRQIQSELMLRLLGKQLSLSRQGASRVFTMENSACRYSQYRDLAAVLSYPRVSQSTEDFEFSIIRFLLLDILRALQATPFAKEIGQVIECLNLSISADRLETSLRSLDTRVQSDRQLQWLVSELVKPMINTYFQSLNAKRGSTEKNQHVANASVYTGLVLLNILKPDSPLDPGKEPLAKVSLINRKLVGTKLRLMAIRLSRGFDNGDFSTEQLDCRQLIDEARTLVDNRKKLEKKVVHRVSTAPLFSEFFREINDFMETAARNDLVLKLARNVETKEGRAAIQGWQRTAKAFCQRVSNEYEAFEEFTGPLITSVQMIQDGLNSLVESFFATCDDTITGTFRQLVEFPFRNHLKFVKFSSNALSYIAHQTLANDDRKRTNNQFAVSLALLSRISLKTSLCGPDVAACCKVIDSLVRSHLKTVHNRCESVEDEEEKEYREQFPDHRKDFYELLEADDENEKLDAETPIPRGGSSTFNGRLNDRQIDLLCAVHDRIFSTNLDGISDSGRTFAFHCAYGAASELENAFDCLNDLSIDTESVGGHVFALSLTIAPTTRGSRVYPHLPTNSGFVDFHNDPLPSVAKLAEEPIGKLMARITQLLTAFPGHSILLGIGRVCERVRKLDLITTPIGKVMTGIEIILKHAQSWEQHASERVQLGTSLEAVGHLVARWRKLELESWPSLLQGRKARHISKARKHWMRLHQVLFEDTAEKFEEAEDLEEAEEDEVSVARLADLQASSPRWIWKGISSPPIEMLPLSDKESSEQISELVKAMDTFVLTSSLGEFEERLRILKSYSIQLTVVYNLTSNCSSWRLMQARVLHSIWSFYSQFSELLSAKLASMRKPIEKELSDEVKLAKWDEQSYYALAESTERNHRKLMRILTKYDECLGLNVGMIIQEESFRGIRADADSSEEVSSSVPSNNSMFPLLDSKAETNLTQKNKTLLEKSRKHATNWKDPGHLDISLGSHIQKIEKYAKKMHLMTQKGTALSKSWGGIGSVIASSICTAIFERLGSLRAKSTRPMKERALVDLFRELKRHGFSSTKWAVPVEAKQMEQVFQLPAPNLVGIHIAEQVQSALAKAEHYYLRCLVEIHAFRSEVRIHGSRHMSTRQIEMMLNLGNCGVYMLAQQRCLLSGVVRNIGGLQDCTTNMRFENASLPTPQSSLRKAVHVFNTNVRSAIESIHELSLFIKSSQGLLNEQKMNWARDAIAKLESLPFSPSSPDSQDGRPKVIEWQHLDAVANDCSELRSAEKIVRDCYNQCRRLECFPCDVFDVPLAKLSQAIKSGVNCKSTVANTSNSNNAATSDLGSFVGELSAAVERALISFQSFSLNASGSKFEASVDADEAEYEETPILDCHRNLSNAWDQIGLERLNDAMNSVLCLACDQIDNGLITEPDSETCLRLISNANILSENVLSVAELLFRDTVGFFAVSAKLNYVLLRLYRVLVAKGFCSDKVSEDDGEADGDVSGMTFEDDQEGTGMGEGEGKTDVTDQLESEEQLLGLKGDNDTGDEEKERESKQLNEEEAEQGMEMENDFDGETFDLPEKQDEKKEDDENDDEGEELDRQMGEELAPDEQVVDERMWNESDDEDGINEDEEKFEKDTNVSGEAIEGETRTKDDDDNNEKSTEDASEKPADTGQEDVKEDGKDDGDEADNETQEMTNENDDDQYEDSHGVDVRDESQDEAQHDEENENGMDLEDDMCLDGGDADEEETNDNKGDQDEMDDSQSADEIVPEGEVDPQTQPDDEDQNENEVAQPMSVTDAGLEPKEDEEVEQEEEDPNENPMKEDLVKNNDDQPAAENAHGVQGNEGNDNMMEDDQEGSRDQQGDDAEAGTSGNSKSKTSDSGVDGDDGYNNERNESEDQNGETNKRERDLDIPNPFRDPGDASKFWHRKLNIIEAEENQEEAMDVEDEQQDDKQGGDTGEFQFSTSDQQGTTQVLAETNEEEVTELDPQNQMEKSEEGDTKREEESKKAELNKNDDTMTSEPSKTKKAANSKQSKEDKETGSNHDDGEDENSAADEVEDGNDNSVETTENEDVEESKSVTNIVVSDMSKLHVDVDEAQETFLGNNFNMIQEDEQVAGISSAEAEEARSHWLQIQGETHSLSRRLCEKLRLVMEPLVASKLRGDYRSGKRINMKRVIGYIASGYRKDKIWLRRTKPAKRNYRVLLAVDDSESMRKSGAGKMALRAMSTLAVGMNQLEIGELGVASFGDDMKLLHPFHLPFTSEAGANMVMNCRFDQPRTRIALCVESAIASLEAYGGDASSMQLVFLISDGRIERDSRAAVRRLVREMVERNILLAMIIVEGQSKKKDSIVNMKEVAFEKGRPVVKQFIDDYPFPYYIVLDDLATLPEVMGDALRQWFEMLAQLKQT